MGKILSTATALKIGKGAEGGGKDVQYVVHNKCIVWPAPYEYKDLSIVDTDGNIVVGGEGKASNKLKGGQTYRIYGTAVSYLLNKGTITKYTDEDTIMEKMPPLVGSMMPVDGYDRPYISEDYDDYCWFDSDEKTFRKIENKYYTITPYISSADETDGSYLQSDTDTRWKYRRGVYLKVKTDDQSLGYNIPSYFISGSPYCSATVSTSGIMDKSVFSYWNYLPFVTINREDLYKQTTLYTVDGETTTYYKNDDEESNKTLNAYVGQPITLHLGKGLYGSDSGLIDDEEALTTSADWTYDSAAFTLTVDPDEKYVTFIPNVVSSNTYTIKYTSSDGQEFTFTINGIKYKTTSVKFYDENGLPMTTETLTAGIAKDVTLKRVYTKQVYQDGEWKDEEVEMDFNGDFTATANGISIENVSTSSVTISGSTAGSGFSLYVIDSSAAAGDGTLNVIVKSSGPTGDTITYDFSPSGVEGEPLTDGVNLTFGTAAGQTLKLTIPMGFEIWDQSGNLANGLYYTMTVSNDSTPTFNTDQKSEYVSSTEVHKLYSHTSTGAYVTITTTSTYLSSLELKLVNKEDKYTITLNKAT